MTLVQGRHLHDPEFRESLNRSRHRGALASVVRHCIEGEHVTLAQMAARLGCSKDAARGRLAREKAKPGAVTWEGLR